MDKSKLEKANQLQGDISTLKLMLFEIDSKTENNKKPKMEWRYDGDQQRFASSSLDVIKDLKICPNAKERISQQVKFMTDAYFMGLKDRILSEINILQAEFDSL